MRAFAIHSSADCIFSQITPKRNGFSVVIVLLLMGLNRHQSELFPPCHPERVSRSPERSEGEGSLRPLMHIPHQEIDQPSRLSYDKGKYQKKLSDSCS